MNHHTLDCQRLVAQVAAAQLDALTISDRIMVCEGIASLYPAQSSEALAAREHAQSLRAVERQQLLLTDLFKRS
jgi:hypothetical protein